MTINEIKELAKKLKDADIERIKEEIKSKEAILKNNDLDEEELGEVLNNLFAILVIEQAFEDEVEGVEEMRAELEQDLMDAYENYDKHMAKYKKDKKEEKKKKKRRWLLDFFALSEDIRKKKETLGDSKKLINRMQNQIDQLKQQASDNNVEKACDHRRGRPHREDMCDCREKASKELDGCGKEKDRIDGLSRGEYGDYSSEKNTSPTRDNSRSGRERLESSSETPGLPRARDIVNASTTGKEPTKHKESFEVERNKFQNMMKTNGRMQK